MKSLATLSLALILTSCSSRPVLYPNEKMKQMGKESANKEVDACLSEADEFLESSKGKAILKSAGRGSIIGGAVGGVFSLITGDWQSLATGAAVGAAGGAAGEAVTPDRLKQAYTNRCLQQKGLQVLGWDQILENSFI